MPVVGGGDIDGIYGFIGQHLAAVFFGFGATLLVGPHNGFDGLGDGPCVHVANGSDLRIGLSRNGTAHAVAPAIDPYRREAYQFVGTDDAVIALGAESKSRTAYCQASGSGSYFFNKVTSVFH